MPSLLDEISAALGVLPAHEREAVAADALAATANYKWVPNPGPQTDGFFCQADETFYGGQAGGGKTDLGIGLSITAHKRSLILRRINKDALKIVPRIEEILDARAGYNGQLQRWKLDGKQIDIAGCEQESDKQRFKGDPHDLIVFDEGTDFQDKQNRMTRELGETVTAIRQKVHEVETWARDEFVRKGSFDNAMGRIEKMLGDQFDRIEARMDRMEKKIDDKMS